MIAIDTNVIVHYLVKSQDEHARIRRWFSQTEEPLATTGTNIAEVFRLLTHPRVFPSPLSLERAADLMHQFVEVCQIVILEESTDWWKELKGLLSEVPSLRGNEIFDARIAICLRYNGVREFFTLDADFSKYKFLKIVRG